MLSAKAIPESTQQKTKETKNIFVLSKKSLLSLVSISVYFVYAHLNKKIEFLLKVKVLDYLYR